MDYAIGRNCRFLQGPKTNPFSVMRIRRLLDQGKEHYETFLNYRRDGSPFMNMLMVAPLFDNRGNVRYHLGAQVDVSGLAQDCSGLPSLRRLVGHDLDDDGYPVDGEGEEKQGTSEGDDGSDADELRELCRMFNTAELETVRKHGGAIHRRHAQSQAKKPDNWKRPRLVIQDDTSIETPASADTLGGGGVAGGGGAADVGNGRLAGIYEHYLLVRPAPTLNILFASPSLRIPGILQSSFLTRIGGSARVRDELAAAFAEGQGMTAKVLWLSRADPEGRPRWLHCTPLMGGNGAVGVWMVVIVDEAAGGAVPGAGGEGPRGARPKRVAPPIAPAGVVAGARGKRASAEVVMASSNFAEAGPADHPEDVDFIDVPRKRFGLVQPGG